MPPGIATRWDDNSNDAQLYLIAYSQIRELEEVEQAAALAGAQI